MAHTNDESTPPDNKHPKSLSVNNLFLTQLINIFVISLLSLFYNYNVSKL